MNKRALDYHNNMTKQFHAASSNPEKNIKRHEENLKKASEKVEDEVEKKEGVIGEGEE